MPKSRAVDSHAHVFGGPDHPFARDVVYVPEPSQRGTARDFLAVLDAHGLTHGLAVAAQPYGYDNRAMLDAIAASGGRLKGIALAPAAISDRDLAALVDGGVVGIRMNLTSYGLREFTEPGADRLLARIREMNLFLQVHCQNDELAAAAPIIRKSGVRLMVDHFGRPDLRRGLAQPGFATLLEFGRAGNAVVKLSGLFRVSREGPPYRDTDPYIAAAIEAFTLDRVVWGSDWPFVRVEERIDYGPQLACVERWLPDPRDRQKLMWDNPVRLFGFT
ncbi:MAG: 2-pyrone-4,6-dicarboxylate hydrolase [Alphaproteobacteria bacterium]|nr:2-pyrone-4,6-dicarboxylate hydrolase [Alphaproteobacteria bacterium]